MRNTVNAMVGKLHSDGVANVPSPALGQLKFAAERVSNAGTLIQYFLNRFYGANPETEATPVVPVSTYRNDIETLFREIDRLESLVQQLDSIG